ncbi:MAG: hypothetical protein K2Q33_01520 [Gammaproteobacteria bacterium]|nr:hypothetical protein [Gammaproteobacteria bacterium]
MYESFELAKFLGVFFTILGLGIMVNQAHIKKVMAVVAENAQAQFVAGIIPLLLGSYIVVVHNVWVASWIVLVTIVGWLIFIAGVVRIILTGFWIGRVRALHDKAPVALIGAIIFILGLVLGFFGFEVMF